MYRRVKPFAGLVRLDSFGYPVVIRPGSVYVTGGTDRRSTGTHYTPRSLTEPIVQYTLEPLVYHGPAEGLPKEKWTLRKARELLDLKICDMACGSGAFLVEADRYLADRLLEAWDELDRKVQTGQQGDLFTQRDRPPATLVRITPYGEPSRGDLFEQVIPIDADERLTFARRIVAQRCLYGVDKNRLAAEMAKLSLWLFTLAKDKPFTFLDHAIRSGDSLIGVSAEQLKTFSLDGKGVGVTLPNFLNMIPKIMEATRLLRVRLEKIADEKISDVEEKERLFANIEQQTKRLTYAADRLLAASWQPAKPAERMAVLREALREVDDRIRDVDPDVLEAEGRAKREEVGCPQPFHWALEFPEVFLDRGGFDAFVCNPPFMGGQDHWKLFGTDYRDLSCRALARGSEEAMRTSAPISSCEPEVYCERWAASDSWRQTRLLKATLERSDWISLSQDGCSIIRAVQVGRGPALPVSKSPTSGCARDWAGASILDDKPVSGITPFSDRTGIGRRKPDRLVANAGNRSLAPSSWDGFCA